MAVTTSRMNYYKKNTKPLIHALGLIAWYLFARKAEDSITLVLTGAIWMLALAHSIYKNIQKRTRRLQGQIRFPTQQDSYAKVASICLGILFIIFSITIFITFSTPQFSLTVPIVIGALLVINGILIGPNGILVIKHSALEFPEPKETIDVNDIVSINISYESISINKSNGNEVVLDRLELTKKRMDRVYDFLHSHLKTEKIKIALREI